MSVAERYNALDPDSRDYVEEYKESLSHCVTMIATNSDQTLRRLQAMQSTTIVNALQYTKKMQYVVSGMYKHYTSELLDQEGSLVFSGHFELVPAPTAKFQLLLLHLHVSALHTSYDRKQVLEAEWEARLAGDASMMSSSEFVEFADMLVGGLEIFTQARALEIFHKLLSHWASDTFQDIMDQGATTSVLTQMLLTVCVDQLTNQMRALRNF